MEVLQDLLINFAKNECLFDCLLYVSAKIYHKPVPDLSVHLKVAGLAMEAGAIKGDGYVVSVPGITRAAGTPIKEEVRSTTPLSGLCIAEVLSGTTTHFVVLDDGELVYDPLGTSNTWKHRTAIKTYRSYARGS